MEIERTPGQPAELPDEDVFEEALGEPSRSIHTGSGELFGDSSIPPTLYHCSTHGDVLAQEVIWKRDGRPHCPDCGAPLDSK